MHNANVLNVQDWAIVAIHANIAKYVDDDDNNEIRMNGISTRPGVFKEITFGITHKTGITVS